MASKYVDFFRNSPEYRSLSLPAVDRAASPKHKRISFCTTCMNRLHDLCKTLPQNILDNLTYPELEFVVLDYSSQDGLGDWAKEHLGLYMEQGLVHFYQAFGHLHYLPSHSRNVSFRLASGDIIVNVDADNFVGRGFARRINQCMSAGENLVAVPESFLLPGSDRILLKGRFAMYRHDLFRLGGYDEELDERGGYSNEDLHLIFRAMLAGFHVVRFEDKYVANRIETPVPDRIKCMRTLDTFESMKRLNESVIAEKLDSGFITSNGPDWGQDVVVHNFSETISTV